jgi:spore germination protein GerM
MDKKRWIVFGLSVVFLLVLIFVFFRGSGQEKIRLAAEISPRESLSESEQPGGTRMVTLFFLAEEDTLFHPEERQIVSSPSDVREAEEVVEELIKGSDKGNLSALPAETRLRQLFITKDGVAYVDFSKELADNLAPGSSTELAAVYSIVNTLAYNFKAIKKVFILVEGGEKETLGGHISLSRAFVPFYSLSPE